MKLRLCSLALIVATSVFTMTSVLARPVQQERPVTRPADPDHDIRLVLACAGGRAADALRLLREGCPVNSRDDRGGTALYFAAGSRREEMIPVVAELIARGAEVNCRTQDDFTPLHQACCTGLPEAVAILLKHGADVTAAEKTYGDQPLHVLAWSAGDRFRLHEEARTIALLLIAHNADLNAMNHQGKTPLNYARDADRKDQAFIDFLADMTHLASKGVTTQSVKK